jgi:hypothetical protein
LRRSNFNKQEILQCSRTLPAASRQLALTPQIQSSPPSRRDLDIAAELRDSEVAEAFSAWPAMIGRHVQRLIDTHAMLGTVAFGPTVVRG